jgi:hypothetical protein
MSPNFALILSVPTWNDPPVKKENVKSELSLTPRFSEVSRPSGGTPTVLILTVYRRKPRESLAFGFESILPLPLIRLNPTNFFSSKIEIQKSKME